MDELIFFAVIIVLSILESIARSRKARRQGREGVPPTTEAERFEWAQTPPWEREAPEPEYELAGSADDALPEEGRRTYDEEPSYDEELSYDERAVLEDTRGREEAPAAPERAPADVAAELWAEITGLATGRAPARTSRLPVPGNAPARVQRFPLPAQRPPETRAAAPARRAGDEHVVHLAHAGYGTDPSERGPSEQDRLYARRERLGPDAEGARALLHGSPATLRQAFILHEVLGPPVSMRDGSGRP